MDLKRHYTHYKVSRNVLRAAEDIVGRFKCSWNTYYDHPEGYFLDSTSVDYWHPRGRGVPLAENTGDAIVAWVLGQRMYHEVRWIIWWGWIWMPTTGWMPYTGWQGMHKGLDAHVHVTYA
jgi:hypothetical protein